MNGGGGEALRCRSRARGRMRQKDILAIQESCYSAKQRETDKRQLCAHSKDGKGVLEQRSEAKTRRNSSEWISQARALDRKAFLGL